MLQLLLCSLPCFVYMPLLEAFSESSLSLGQLSLLKGGSDPLLVWDSALVAAGLHLEWPLSPPGSYMSTYSVVITRAGASHSSWVMSTLSVCTGVS